MLKFFCFFSCFVFLAFLGGAQTVSVSHETGQSRITQPIDETALVKLPGSSHPLARPEFDRGPAPPYLPLERMLLVLKHSAAQDAALKQLLDDQQNPASPKFHHWLTPQQFGAQFGPSTQDIQKITAWLASHGFQSIHAANARTLIEFSGTARQVEESFHAPIHKFTVNGKEHWANAADQQIPAALAPVVAGVATLHNFEKKPLIHISAQTFTANYHAGSRPEMTYPNGDHALSPADFNVIYNVTNPNDHSGSISIVARSNVDLTDLNDFNNLFGTYPIDSVVVNGVDPGTTGDGDEIEAVLDASWAGGISNSRVTLVVSASTNSTDGVFLSEEYIIDNNSTDIMSESFGGCEAEATRAEAVMIATLAAEAATQGITYIVSSGDSGSALCDDPAEISATGPLSVNVLASTPYTLAVGGTEFDEGGSGGKYWRSTNGSGFESAISHIPENVWNESCSTTCSGGNLWAGGGGASKLFSKPSWQTGVRGIPNDGVRDVPDVSFNAAGRHDPYLICLYRSCEPDSTGQIHFVGIGGTSASAPSFAGLISSVAIKSGNRVGQADYVLYALAANQNFGQCNGSSSTPAASTCIFNDVTVGNNAVPGEAGYGTPSATYQAGIGYDLASGLGSINAANLWAQYAQQFSACCASSPLAVSPANVDFGTSNVASATAINWVNISNAGPNSVPLSIGVTGANPSSFVLTDNCPANLPPGGNCALGVQFEPVVPGLQQATLVVSAGTPHPPNLVDLSGSGAAGSTTFGGQQPGDVQVTGDFDGDGELDFAVWRPWNGIWYVYSTKSPGVATEEQWGLPGDIPVPADYDGDGITDYAVWRPSNGTWFIIPSRTRTPYSWQWGLPGDIPVVGDFDGDEKADLVVWRPSNQTWYLILSSNPQPLQVQWGLPGDVPVTGDFDGSGRNEMAVWRPSNGTWYVISARTGLGFTQQWGLPGDVPVTLDFNNDGVTDFTVWRPSEQQLYIKWSGQATAWDKQPSGSPLNLFVTQLNLGGLTTRGVLTRVTGDFDGDGQPDFAVVDSAGNWFVLPSSNPASPIQQAWGFWFDLPVPGDYNGGKTDFASYWPAEGQWMIMQLSDPYLPLYSNWGLPGDIPVPADYDGDGTTDIAVWRPATGEWWIIPSSNPQAPYVKQWGLPGDIPVPADYDGDGKTDIAVWRPPSGVWYIAPSDGSAPYTKQLGFFGDVPVPGDFDGDGKIDFVTWRPSLQAYDALLSSQPSTPVQIPSGLTGNAAVYRQPR